MQMRASRARMIVGGFLPIQHHPVNLRYIESKKRWADKWRAKVNDGITGKLPIAVAQ